MSFKVTPPQLLALGHADIFFCTCIPVASEISAEITKGFRYVLDRPTTDSFTSSREDRL